MNKSKSDFDLCYQCGWLGLCVIACPLADSAHALHLESSTHPDLDASADECFEIVVETGAAGESRPIPTPAENSA